MTAWLKFLDYSFIDYFEMQRASSLDKVNGDTVTNARNASFARGSPDTFQPSKRKHRGTFTNIFERYSITIKPKLHRSNSLSDLTAKTSDFTQELLKHSTKLNKKHRETLYGSSGDAFSKHCTKYTYDRYMSWNFKGNKRKGRNMTPENYNSKFTNDYVLARERDDDSSIAANITTSTENSSISTDQNSVQKGATFPFKSTPSGNLKVQSNQVVFQSSTVGVLLADPTQAKVKVKFEGKSPDELQAEINRVEDFNESEAQYPYSREVPKPIYTNERSYKIKPNLIKEDKGKDLTSLGYGMAEPIDWLRIQLPKKQDLFQEFYRRIHNFIKTDTIVHIGDEDFHCHRLVLQVYSNFFDNNIHSEIELPVNNVTPEAFQTIYEWMIFSGADSNKALKRDNVLDLFCAAQYLSIKDLEDQCWSFIVNENLFNEDTAFALYREARVKGLSPVMDLMVPRVMRFFLPLVASKDFLDLEIDEVTTFLRSNYICVTSEIEVLMAGVRWLYADWTSRRKKAVDVMQCVRFGLISPWQLVDIKRNPDNAEILEIVSEQEIQQMVDDGLAYVIIKYWYGNNSKNYYHWIDVLGLTEPAERNWIGEEKNHVTYKDFLKYLEQFMVPREQMYQQMALLQPPRRNDDDPNSLRGMNEKSEMRRPKMDFPLPATLTGLTGDKGKSFPTMSEFFESRRKVKERDSPPPRSPDMEPEMTSHRQQVLHDRRRSPDPENRPKPEEVKRLHLLESVKQQVNACRRRNEVQQIHMCTLLSADRHQHYDVPVRDSAEETGSTLSETSSFSVGEDRPKKERRYSMAASYFAAATTALQGTRKSSLGGPATGATKQSGVESSKQPVSAGVTRSESRSVPVPNNVTSPQISLFNQSKESLAKMNMNKLSTSILGPSNKNYITDGSLFNWDRETVLLFGGIDPHTAYGVGRNTGKDIYRFDPVANVWDYVGDLPEPRHHHSVAFLRGRVYLVGGADPRDDDIRGKSVVVSTVWSYEPVTRSWYSENGLLTSRKNFGLVVHRMALYAIGGQDKKGRVLRSVERFDPKTGSWTEVRSMGIARMAVATVKYREYIWVAGGMTGEKKRPVCKIVECYNSKTNEWTEIHSLRFPRCFSTLFAMNDKLYIVGGAGKITDKDKTASSVGAIDVWDWKERNWKLETEMSIPRHGHALAYLGTQLIIIGGVTTIYMKALNNVESFCCERGAWIRGVTPLPAPLSGHGAVTLPPASLM